MGSMNMSILSMKVFLIAAGVVSLAIGIKFSVPLAVNEFPVIWSIVLSWLKPLYLYIIINAMIITIVASSRFHQSQSEPLVRSEHLISVKTPPPSYYESLSAQKEIATVVEEYTAAAAAAGVYDEREDRVVEEDTAAAGVYGESEDRVVEIKPVMVNGSKVFTETEEVVAEAKDVSVDSMLTFNSPSEEIIFPEFQSESLLTVREKPLVSSRFGHRKPIRTSPEGVRALRVARPKRHETLENTWKMITEGRHVPLTTHLKKSDSWEHHLTAATSIPPDHVPKSETFKDRANYDSSPAPASSRIRKEPSQSQDELNRRVEAFIKNFNDEMRLQRQESLNQYKEMIKRGL